MTVQYAPTNTVEILASAARTELVAATSLQVPDGCDMVEVLILATAAASTPTLTFTIKDAGGSTLLASAATSMTSSTSLVLRYGLHVTAVANLAAQGIPTSGMTFEVAVGDTDSCTYSVRCRTT